MTGVAEGAFSVIAAGAVLVSWDPRVSRGAGLVFPGWVGAAGRLGSPVLLRKFGLDVPGVRTGAGRAQPVDGATVPLGHPRQRLSGGHPLIPLPVTTHTGHGHLFRHEQKLLQ
jgi:hypothetical protein